MMIAGIFSYWWKNEIDANLRYRLSDALLSSAKYIETTPSDLQTILNDLPHLLDHKSFVKEVEFLYAKTPSDPKNVTISYLANNKVSGTIAIYSSDKVFLGNLTATIDSTDYYQHYHQKFWLVVLLTSLICFLMIAFVLIIANWMAKPIQKLNNTALSIAAGKYGETLSLKGPKEVVQLSNTLNIMSECLLENINQLTQTANILANTYDEKDCFIHLQKELLEIPIEESKTDIITAKPLSFISNNPQGLKMSFVKETDTSLEISVTQAEKPGLFSICELFTKKGKRAYLQLILDKKNSQVDFTSKEFPAPYFWSMKQRDFLDPNCPIQLSSGDYFFLLNPAFSKLLKEKNFEPLFIRVCKFFAEDGFESLVKMLEKEIQMQLKKHSIQEDLHLICFQLLY